ncbi:MAG: class I mannose-6-phosphate isomerase [Bacteroidales bacterium]|jgi:mannose-6-phosphate isomerase|nr:class I mannose-6-phosphate isomerase [Bacteroidales bacterium]
MNGLYPLKFKPIFREKIWGGNKIKSILNKDPGNILNCGESWEISTVEDFVSEVANGFLAGNYLNELVEIYMGDLVGEKVYQKYGNEFPLLLKFIDAARDVSIQVHPNDSIAKERHNAYGKSEMWYIINAENKSLINPGFNQPVTREKFLDFVSKGKLMDLLKFDNVSPGDAYFVPAGQVHSIGKGVLLAEIQQISDVTYRISDFDRKNAEGNKRELHIDWAVDAINYDLREDSKINFNAEKNNSTELVCCNYFTTNILEFNKKIDKDYNQIDSFIIYMNLEGDFLINYEKGSELVKKGETILIPACLETFQLIPISSEIKTLEVYIK